jgi:tryptophanyl-tRNA synthetase
LLFFSSSVVYVLERKPMSVEMKEAVKPANRSPQLKKRTFSGIQPTGNLHLGNYLGALRNWVEKQAEYDNIFCIVDLHAITMPIDPKELHQSIRQLAALYIASGLDERYCKMFVQSHVHEHAELAWVLGTVTGLGELRRMTQFKDRVARYGEGAVSAGLFTYPVLQAADILIYQADRVPVGEDQRQHLELTRDIATRFNQRFGETFVLPQAAIPKVGARVMDLQDSGAKMSASSESPQGRIDLTDDADAITRKVKTAVTDSGREIVLGEDKPAIGNLLTIFSVAAGKPIPEIEREYEGKGYAEFKADLAEALVDFFGPIQERFRELATDPGEISRQLEIGAEKAQAVASKTLQTVYEKVGFLPRGG